MTEQQSNRFIELTQALQFDSYGEKYLTDFDRMFIQKERSALFNNKDYTQTNDLEEKIQNKLIYINRIEWESPF